MNLEAYNETALLTRRRALKDEFAALLGEPDVLVQGDVFSYPNWPVVVQNIKRDFLAEQHLDAMHAVLFHWLENLCRELGGDYHFREHGSLILLSDLEPSGAEQSIRFIEKARDAIRNILGECAWHDVRGYEVMMFFDEDDYYDYISHYYPEGTFPGSGGIFIRDRYTHSAIPLLSGALPGAQILHELTHSAVAKYQVPRWLNEAIAGLCEREYNPYGRSLLTPQLVAEHNAYWNEDTIQGFWAGTSFGEEGIQRELSYSLAPVVLQWLQAKGDRLSALIRNADPNDAGQTAALDCLGVCLGDAVANFLGPGDWRPKRKAIAELRRISEERQKKTSTA